MDFLHNWTSSNTIALLALIVSSLTLLLGFKAYRKLIAQEARKEQLRIVNNLVNDIVVADIRVKGRQMKNTKFRFGEYNLFDFAAIGSLDLEDRRYLVILSHNIFESELLQVFKDIRNPLLPPKIANSVYALTDILMRGKVFFNHLQAPVFVLGNSDDLVNGIEGTPQLQLHTGLGTWVQNCKNIQSSIFEWYQTKNVDQINLLALRLDKFI